MNRRLAFVILSALAAAWMLSPGGIHAQLSPHGEEIVAGRLAAAGEILVRFRPDAASHLPQIDKELDADAHRPLGGGSWHRIHSASRTVQTLLTALSGRAEVLEVEPNYIVHAALVPNDPLFPQLWGLSNGGQPGADIHA